MKKIETLVESGMEIFQKKRGNFFVLRDKETGKREVWSAKDNPICGYQIEAQYKTYKGGRKFYLEFCHSI